LDVIREGRGVQIGEGGTEDEGLIVIQFI
jgi:hypothetical protein